MGGFLFVGPFSFSSGKHYFPYILDGFGAIRLPYKFWTDFVPCPYVFLEKTARNTDITLVVVVVVAAAVAVAVAVAVVVVVVHPECQHSVEG